MHKKLLAVSEREGTRARERERGRERDREREGERETERERERERERQTERERFIRAEEWGMEVDVVRVSHIIHICHIIIHICHIIVCSYRQRPPRRLVAGGCIGVGYGS